MARWVRRGLGTAFVLSLGLAQGEAEAEAGTEAGDEPGADDGNVASLVEGHVDDEGIESAVPEPGLWTTDSPTHLLRPDFEIPTDVLIAYSDATPEEADGLARAIAPAAHVVVVPAEETPTKTVSRWYADLPASVQRRTTIMLKGELDSVWVRDFGPFVAYRGKKARWMDTGYNVERPLDDEFPRLLGRWAGIRPKFTETVIDGGAVVSDGRGHCVSTVEYWGEPGFGDGAERDEVLWALGCAEMLLLPALRLDHTMHVDMFVQFLSEDRVLVGEVSPEEDIEDARRMDLAAETLDRWAAERNRHLEIIRVPIPVLGEGRYFSYVNLLQLEGRLVVPSYTRVDRKRQNAIYEILAEAAPGHDIAGVDMPNYRSMGGAVHCATLGLRLGGPVQWRH